MIIVDKGKCSISGVGAVINAEICILLKNYMTILHKIGLSNEKIREELLDIATRATEGFLESIEKEKQNGI